LKFPFNAGGKFQRQNLSSFNAGGGSFNAGGGSFNTGVSLQRRRLRRSTCGIGAGASTAEVGVSTLEFPFNAGGGAGGPVALGRELQRRRLRSILIFWGF